MIITSAGTVKIRCENSKSDIHSHPFLCAFPTLPFPNCLFSDTEHPKCTSLPSSSWLWPACRRRPPCVGSLRPTVRRVIVLIVEADIENLNNRGLSQPALKDDLQAPVQKRQAYYGARYHDLAHKPAREQKKKDTVRKRQLYTPKNQWGDIPAHAPNKAGKGE